MRAQLLLLSSFLAGKAHSINLDDSTRHLRGEKDDFLFNVVDSETFESRYLQNEMFCPRRSDITVKRKMRSIDDGIKAYLDLENENGEKCKVTDDTGFKHCEFDWQETIKTSYTITGVDLNESVAMQGDVNVFKRMGCKLKDREEIWVSVGSISYDCTVCGEPCLLDLPIVEPIKINIGDCPSPNLYSYDLLLDKSIFPEDSGVYGITANFKLLSNETEYVDFKVVSYLNV